MGKLIDAGTAMVFLTRGERNYVVRTGDTVEETYRVEEIGEQTMLLTYIPLGIRQHLTIGNPVLVGAGAVASEGHAESEVPQPLRASAPPTHDQTKLVWLAPPAVEIGEEFMIEIGLPAGPQPRTGRVELVYDGLVLTVLGGAMAGPDGGDAGLNRRRAIVDVIGPGFPGGQPTPSEVRFRVLAGNPTTTQIAIQNLSAVTTSGSTITVQSPSAHRLAVVQGSGTRSKSE